MDGGDIELIFPPFSHLMYVGDITAYEKVRGRVAHQESAAMDSQHFAKELTSKRHANSPVTLHRYVRNRGLFALLDLGSRTLKREYLPFLNQNQMTSFRLPD